MFACERCGAAFSPIRIGAGSICPRCRARDGVSVPLTFRLFDARSKNVESRVDSTLIDSSSMPVEVEQETE
jgi:hypothetical protein